MSLRSIEDSFNPTKIKEVVEDLIMSKYGFRFQKNMLKSTSRRLKFEIGSSSSSSNCENSLCSGSIKSTSKESDLNVSTSDLSDLILNSVASTTPSQEEDEETSGDKSADLSLQLRTRKEFILLRTREQILKAIQYQENQKKLSFYKERLEAEKLLLVTDLRLECLSWETAERKNLQSVNRFYSGNIEISNIRIFPKFYDNQHFVCLIISGSKVFATEGGKLKSNGGIYFNQKITIPNLQSDFKLRLEIYSTTAKALKTSTSLQTLHNFRDYGHDNYVPFRKSSYSLWEKTHIKACNHSKTGHLQVQLDAGMLTACISTHANVNKNLSSFVHVNEVRENILPERGSFVI